MSSEQLPLNFDFMPSLEGADFLVAACNEEAVQWLDRWPDWPSPFLLIHGPKSSGKTHLVEVFKQATQGVQIEPGPDPYEIMGDNKVAILEDIDRVIKDHENALFHLYNFAKENGCWVLLTARQGISDWAITLADLKSRLGTVATVEIGQPDDALLEALIVKLFSDRQLMVERDVIAYLLTRIERSFEAVAKAVDKIDKQALQQQRKVTIPLVRDLLKS